MTMALDIKRTYKPIRKLRKSLKGFSKELSPAEVHDFRTRARRAQAVVEAFGLDGRPNERRMLRNLAKLRKRAGKIRDMDVLTAFTSQLQADGDSDCKVQLLEHLGAQRLKHAKKTRWLLRKDGSALLKRLKRTSTRTQKLLQRAQRNGDGAAPTAMAEALRLSSELADPPRLDRKNLHPYRLKVKQLRYVLQMAPNSDQAKFVEKLGEVKDAIGEWHDWEELIVIAEDVLDHRPSCGLIRELKVISQQKYQRALHLANGLREEYVRSSRTPRGKKSRELARPVLRATSAMAA
jgi:CHAD domain-containing protein